MRRFCLGLALTCLVFGSHAQYFSGELIYQVKVIPKGNLNADSLLALQLGTSSTYLITNRYYKSTYFKNNKFTYSYTYHDESKRMYDETADKNYITFRDSRKGNASRIRSIQYKDSVKVVAGHPCFMVERVYENYITKTYYAKDLKINPEDFKGHAVGDWYQQIKDVEGALSLMSVSEYATHIEIHEVIKIIPRVVKRVEFDLPNKLVVASSLALEKGAELIAPTKATIECYQKKMRTAPVMENNYICYVGFIVSSEGIISNVEPYEKDELGLYKIATDIIATCGLKFSPGQIEGKAVSSLVYFPIEFQKN